MIQKIISFTHYCMMTYLKPLTSLQMLEIKRTSCFQYSIIVITGVQKQFHDGFSPIPCVSVHYHFRDNSLVNVCVD
jgi:hypothetical protein